uniref:Uncharacterized protein n=1 Tax=Cucumis sativus TaxID=3659 RepID=A0A0A0L8K3_CUCSA
MEIGEFKTKVDASIQYTMERMRIRVVFQHSQGTLMKAVAEAKELTIELIAAQPYDIFVWVKKRYMSWGDREGFEIRCNEFLLRNCPIFFVNVIR